MSRLGTYLITLAAAGMFLAGCGKPREGPDITTRREFPLFEATLKKDIELLPFCEAEMKGAKEFERTSDHPPTRGGEADDFWMRTVEGDPLIRINCPQIYGILNSTSAVCRFTLLKGPEGPKKGWRLVFPDFNRNHRIATEEIAETGERCGMLAIQGTQSYGRAHVTEKYAEVCGCGHQRCEYLPLK